MSVVKRLARWRVPLGFLSAIAVLWLATPTTALVAWGSAVAACGEGLRIWAAGHLNKSREVTRSGPYRYFAHPLYVGSATMGVGLGIASGSVWVVAIIAIYLAATIAAAVRSEEAFLRGKFGADYETYRHGAPQAGDRDRSFSLAQAMANREYRALGGLVLAVLLLLIKATL